MKLLQTLLSRHHPVPPRVVAAAEAQIEALIDALSDASTDAPTDAPIDPEESAPGCGWFDSSHELRAGLQVHEHAANDGICAELPLAHWLALQQA